MDVFPAVFPLKGVRVAVAGEGPAADAKARLFDGAPAEVVRVSTSTAASRDAYRGVRLAFIALMDPAAAPVAADAARAAGALVNVVDRPELCDFNTPALVDRGAVVGAIATGGQAPALAAELRQSLEAQWPEGLGRVAELLDRMKSEIRRAAPASAVRRTLLRRLVRGQAAAAARAGRWDEAQALVRSALADDPQPGRWVLARAPAEPDLLTLRLLRRLSEADVVVADAQVHPGLLGYARRDAMLQILSPGADWTPDLPPGCVMGVRLSAGATPGVGFPPDVVLEYLDGSEAPAQTDGGTRPSG